MMELTQPLNDNIFGTRNLLQIQTERANELSTSVSNLNKVVYNQVEDFDVF